MSIDEVVVLPCVPATAIEFARAQIAASIPARVRTATPVRRWLKTAGQREWKDRGRAEDPRAQSFLPGSVKPAWRGLYDLRSDGGTAESLAEGAWISREAGVIILGVEAQSL